MSGTASSGRVERRFAAWVQVRNSQHHGVLELTFDSRSPWAVGVALQDAGTTSYRALLRKMLDRGLQGRVRSRGVMVWVSPFGRVTPEVLHICYPNDTVPNEWIVPVSAVYQFLCDTYRLVPKGAEGSVVDLDAELATLRSRPE